MGTALEQFKQRARATWAAGNFDVVAQQIPEVGRGLVERAGTGPGMRVLDVACGTGNTTIPAALAGAKVTGLDLTPELFEAARRHAAEAGVEIDFVEGDAEALPFDDDSFDRVLSSFGVMFAPRHAVAAAELVRVCAPGGLIVVANWTPDGLIGRMFKLTAARMPPPPPFASPPILWGDEQHVRELFEPHGIDLVFERREAIFRGSSVEEIVTRMEQNFGPWQALRAAVGEDEWPTVRAQLSGLYEEANRATGRAESVGEYLLTIGRK